MIINGNECYDANSIANGLFFSLPPQVSLNTDDIFMDYTMARILNQYTENVTYPSGVGRKLGHKALLALCTCYFGLENKERSVFGLGLRRYGSTLENVRLAVADPSRYNFGDLLESIVLLSLIEVGVLLECCYMMVTHNDLFFFFFS